MSIHPSLTASEKDKKSRSVLKRTERLKKMIEKELWKEGQSIFGLPKLKTTRLKIKKEKAAPAAAAAGTEAKPEGGAPAPAAGAPTAKEAKPAAKTTGK